jgi:drug/metabolite transporter (DMT)-like permease
MKPNRSGCDRGEGLFNTRGVGFLCILLSLLFQSISLIFAKYAALRMTGFTLQAILTNYFYLASLLCLGLQAVCWPLALRRFPLFWSYAFMSGVYVVIPLISHFIFKEHVSLRNIIGSITIMVGIAVMCARGREIVGHA